MKANGRKNEFADYKLKFLKKGVDKAFKLWYYTWASNLFSKKYCWRKCYVYFYGKTGRSTA